MHGRYRESEFLRNLFETTVARCIAEGLVSGQRMADDASLNEEDANKQNQKAPGILNVRSFASAAPCFSTKSAGCDHSLRAR